MICVVAVCQQRDVLSLQLQAMHLVDDHLMSVSGPWVARGKCRHRSSSVSAYPGKLV